MEILFCFSFTFLRRGKNPFHIHLVTVPLHSEKAMSAQIKLILRSRELPDKKATINLKSNSNEDKY